MKAQWVGRPGDPDTINMWGFTFERRGEPVEIPNDHMHAEKIANNPEFRVDGAPKAMLKPVHTKEASIEGVIAPPASPARA